jgi:hypothetical protein
VNRPIASYRPSRRYAIFTALALAAAIASAWVSSLWGTSWLVASILLGLTAIVTFALALRPAIEIHGTHLRVGERVIFWNEIQQLDRISVMNFEPWIAPLLLRITLAGPQAQGQEELMLFHPGDMDSCVSLLRHIYRYSKRALLDGVTYNQFWGEQPPIAAPLELPRPRLLLPEDEEEVERLFQKLKVAGRLDGSDES